MAEEKGKIQVVAPLSLQQRWDTLQDSPKYKDQAKYKLMEDMIASMEITVLGAEHPEYEQQLADVEKCWTTVRDFLSRLIDESTKAEETARKRVANTLRTLEREVDKIPSLENERDEYWHKYYDVRTRNEDLAKALKEEKSRTAEAEARCKEAEAKAAELQNRLNVANEAIVKQMQEFMSKYDSVEKAESFTEVVTADIASAVSPVTTADNIKRP